jgi:hypothetical protein
MDAEYFISNNCGAKREKYPIGALSIGESTEWNTWSESEDGESFDFSIPLLDFFSCRLRDESNCAANDSTTVTSAQDETEDEDRGEGQDDDDVVDHSSMTIHVKAASSNSYGAAATTDSIELVREQQLELDRLNAKMALDRERQMEEVSQLRQKVATLESVLADTAATANMRKTLDEFSALYNNRKTVVPPEIALAEKTAPRKKSMDENGTYSYRKSWTIGFGSPNKIVR